MTTMEIVFNQIETVLRRARSLGYSREDTLQVIEQNITTIRQVVIAAEYAKKIREEETV